jgi:hypothetical protein
MVDSVSVKFKMQFEKPLSVWVLQVGGYLPIQFTNVGVLMVDRNVTSALAGLMSQPNRTDMDAERWWLNHLNSESYVLNPFLCAVEGRTRSVPSYVEFCDELIAANKILAISLPKARLIEHDPQCFGNLYENVRDMAKRQERESAFLLDVCPTLAARLALSDASKFEKNLLGKAVSHGLSLRSLVVLAALSCLYEPQGGEEPRIGRGVLKPRLEYAKSDAYNALADIRSLEFLAAANGLPAPSSGFCTRDKYLAAFWTFLGVGVPTWSNRTFLANLQPNSNLFPRLSDSAYQALMSRLQ